MLRRAGIGALRRAARRLVVLLAVPAMLLPALAADAGDVQRGRALYLGQEVLSVIGDDGRARPMPQAACVQCHRRSALGSFEGALAAPPIAGRLLFEPYDPDTGRFFRDARRYRVRPAYDEGSLRDLLATGVAPDGHRVRAAMPRYDLGAREAADIAAYLRTVGQSAVPGLEAGTVRLAAVFTPAADADSRQAMERVMQRFVAIKNAQSRQDAQRALQAERSREMVMSRKFRVWQLESWTLEGEPGTWAAQLERLDRERPAFALVGGIGGDDWLPVHRFCEARQMPCLLPWLDEPPDAGDDFFSLYFHPGRALDLQLAAEALRASGARRVRVWGGTTSPASLAATLARAGLERVDAPGFDGVLSLLPPKQHLERLADSGADLEAAFVAWAPGPRLVTADDWARAAAPLSRGLFVTPLKLAAAGEAQRWPRSETWLRQQGLAGVPPELGAATLQALTTIGDALAHIDFAFTREYVLERLEHGLENMISFGPYDRLAVAPGQRIAVKGSHVAQVRDGHALPWSWQLAPASPQNREITATEVSARPLR